MIDINKPCAIFFDIDGTLLGNNMDAFRENLNTIQKVRSLGHKVFICTGRSYAFIPSGFDAANSFDGVVAGAGAYVRMGDRTVVNQTVPYDILSQICDCFLRYNVSGALEGVEMVYAFGNIAIYDDILFDADNFTFVTPETAASLITENVPISKLTIDGTAPDELIELLKNSFFFIDHGVFSEFIPIGMGKAEGIKTVLSELGIKQSQSIAVGDSRNDLDMLEYAELSVAMGNAIDEVKGCADMVTDDVDNAGAARALERIFKLK